MTDPNRKPRWTLEEKRQARTGGGVERRAKLAGQREARMFRVGPSSGASIRSSSSNTTGLMSVSGTPIVYSRPYQVFDQFGSFMETMAPTVVSGILPTCDCRFLFDHAGLPLARTTSGTLTLTNTPQSLNFTAELDPRQTLANDLCIALDRKDVTQMSCGFMVGSDQWNEDFTQRTIFTFGELMDVSAVTYPASPTTFIELLDELPPVGGPDGSMGEGTDGAAAQDGSGARSRKVAIDRDRMAARKRLIDIDLDVARLSGPLRLP